MPRLIKGTTSSGSDKLPDLTAYQVNDLDDNNTTASVLYIGMEDEDGNWCVKKFDESTAATPAISYATVTNNAGTTTYSTAWANIGSLTYGDYSAAF